MKRGGYRAGLSLDGGRRWARLTQGPPFNEALPLADYLTRAPFQAECSDQER